MGRCLYSQDRMWEARVAFQRVVDECEDVLIRESALFDLMLVLGRIRRQRQLILAADRYLELFGENEQFQQNGRVAAVEFMKAEAWLNLEEYEQAEIELLALLENYPNHAQLTRIRFYLALSQAMQEKFDESIPALRAWLEQYPNDYLASEVKFWLPTALYYAGQYGEARELYLAYLEQYPGTVYAPEARYRAALCLYGSEDFKNCALELGAWLKEHPDHYFRGEALVTRGDALAAEGLLDNALEQYLAVTADDGPYYFMALTQAARVFRAQDTPEGYRQMAQVFIAYIRERPDSGNVVTAAHEAGDALKRLERTDEAREFYWSILRKFGNRRDWEGFNALYDDLWSLYEEEPGIIRSQLQDDYSRALKEKELTLASRLKRAMIPSDQSAEERLLSAQRMARVFPQELLGAEEMAFLAESFLAGGDQQAARAYYDQLLEAFPDSMHSARAYTERAHLALQDEQYEAAFKAADQAVRLAMDVDLLIRAQFLRAQAARLAGQYDQAISDYNAILAQRGAPGEFKAQGLLGIGQCYGAQEDWNKAIPYYQRIYLLYGAYTNEMAQAYLESAEAFERLGDYEAARNTYREMLSQESLEGHSLLTDAREKLATLP
jgi:tetratricopeptide (TPR) repeat protein